MIESLLRTGFGCTMHPHADGLHIKRSVMQWNVLTALSIAITAIIMISGCHKSPRAARPSAPVNPNRASSTQASSVKPSNPTSDGSRPDLVKPDLIKAGFTETGIASWYGIPYHGRRAASGEVFDMEQLTAAHKTLPFQTWVEVTNLDNGNVVIVRINDRGPFIDGRIIDLSKRGASEIGMLQAGLAKVRLRVMDASEVSASIAGPQLKTRPAVVAKDAAKDAAKVEAAEAESPKALLSLTASPQTAPPQMASPTARSIAAKPAPSSYTVQAGTFADRMAAEVLAKMMAARFGDARVLLSPATPVATWRVVVGRGLSLGEAGQIFLSIRSDVGSADVIPEPDTARAH